MGQWGNEPRAGEKRVREGETAGGLNIEKGVQSSAIFLTLLESDFDF